MWMTRRGVLAAGAASAALGACAHGSGAPEGAPALAAQLDALATNILRESPEFATSLAVTEAQAGGRYMDRLSDASRAGVERRRALAERALAGLKALDRAQLGAGDAVTYDVVVTALENSVAAARFPFGGGATSPYVVSQLEGAHTSIPDFLASRHPVTDRETAEAYLTRLSAYARMLDQESARIPEDAAAGVIPPLFCIEREGGGAVTLLRTFAAIPPAENVLVARFAQRLEAVEIGDKASLVARAEAILRQEVLPAYARQIDALIALKPRANNDSGAWKLPDGEALYAAALRNETTTALSADEIHAMGVDLVSALNAEMDRILRGQGMTRGSVAERVRALSQRPDQIYPSTEEGRARLLADLNAQVEAIRARMGEVCGALARAPLEIKRVPAYIEAGAPGGYYQVPALDGSRPGAYYINLRDPAGEWPKFTLPTLTYHEGVPGHHWQIALSQEAGGLPFIRSALLGFNAFSEGWALYAEQLADEMGFYANDAFGKVGYLQSAAFRASRLVVDTGLHAKRWTREQAIASMMEATGDNESNIVTEVERYCVIPGQACGYMVGRQAILKMRADAQATLGARFDLRGFHDAVLLNGATPLNVTERLVRDWVETQRA